ncbi:MAG: hypothetical protein HYY17_04345 [Planctomycetes bacterium]|nr:hypothetical protein [Planctomycetota bacterium]
MAARPDDVIWLETSSYLPLIWRTPYSRSVVEFLARHAPSHRLLLQRDCILEAAGYFSFEDNWKYHPAVRIRNLLRRLSDEELQTLGYPSAAVQLLIGGNIWPQGQYLNFVRHTGFLFADLLDGTLFDSPRRDLGLLAERIEERVSAFRRIFQEHAAAREVALPTDGILPYWGRWYLPHLPAPFKIEIVPDPRPYNMTADKLRDIFHYDCAVRSDPMPRMMFVANTGFQKNVKTSFADLPCPIVCAKTSTAEILG